MNKEKIHFLGINGSGIAGVACLAKKMGYDVTGCDLNPVGNYTKQLQNLAIDVLEGQSREHIKNINTLVVSAAVFFQNRHKDIDEITYAMDNGIKVLKWQEFIDKYLAKDQNFIGVCGTHGKTTTTTFVADLLEDLQQDPSAIIGGINSRWGTSYRYGKGKYFVCESDEYGNNFWEYHPKYIIINNIEMEHPEFFKTFEDYLTNFGNFIKNIKEDGVVVFNADDKNIITVLSDIKDFLNKKNIKLIGYSLNNVNIEDYKICNIIISKNSFILQDKTYTLNDIVGEHNLRNAIVSVLLMLNLGFGYDEINKSLKKLKLPKRRMEKIFDNGNVKLYDEYAHHHTQIHFNLKTLKENIEPDEKIIAIWEPHMISRFVQNSKEHINYMEIADYPIITEFYKSREINLDVPDMKSYLKGTKIKYIEKFDDVIEEVKKILKKEKKVSIVVMGAGKSYRLSESLCNILKK